MKTLALTPQEILQVMKRRRLLFLIPFWTMIIVGTILALFLPSYYRATATILIEEQEIPQSIVASMVTSYAEQRLQMINQHITSYAQLSDLINRFNLYKDIKSNESSEKIAEKMRKDIKFETISSDVIDKRTGKSAKATIAFTVSYIGENPNTVLQVTNELASLYLKENQEVRTKQSEDTSLFLQESITKVKRDLDANANKIMEFKEKHFYELPDLLQHNIQRVASMEQSIDSLKDHLVSLKEQEKNLTRQLSQISPDIENVIKQKRLDELNMTLMTLKSKFSNDHPDVVRTEIEVKTLEKQLKEKKTAKSLNKGGRSDNPEYVTLSSQLANVRAEIDSINSQISEKKRNISVQHSRIGTTSRIENEYNGLITEQVNLKNKYNDLSQKLMEAKMSFGLETEQKGEKLTLLEPAKYPEKPFKPNRFLILIITIIVGAGLGFALVFTKEVLDDSLWDSRLLVSETKLPVLGTIPYIPKPGESYRSSGVMVNYVMLPVALIILIFIISKLFHRLP